MARKEIGTVSFSITGEFITEQCRSMVLSGNWRGAIAILEDVNGFGMDNSIRLLKGEIELYGNSAEEGIFMREQDQEDEDLIDYLKTFKFQHSGLYMYKNKVYRPEYLVTAFNIEDVKTAMAIHGKNDRSSAFFRARSFHYAPSNDYIATGPLTSHDRREGDYDEGLVSKKAMLWKPVDDYPIWVTPHRKIEDAISEFTENRGFRYLKETGATFESSEDSETITTENAFENAEIVVEAITEIVDEVVTETPKPAEKRKYTRDMYEDQEKEKQDKHDSYIQRIRDEICSKIGPKGGDDWLRMPHYKDGESMYKKGAIPDIYIDVPRLAFLHWALRNIPAVKLGIIEDWTPVSRSGLKMYNDDQYHSDWVIAAGYDPEVFYQEHDDINTSAYSFAMDIVRNMTDFDLIVLSKSLKKSFSGKIKHLKAGEKLEEGEVGVISHAGVEFDAALRSAAKHKTGLICLTGGPMAHVVVVGRELDVPIVMWDKAQELWNYHHVSVNTEEGTVHVSPH